MTKTDWRAIDWKNAGRNIAAHGLLAFAALSLAQIAMHVEGWVQPRTGIAYFGHGLIYQVTANHKLMALIPVSQSGALLWHILPIFVVLVLGAAYLEPKRAVPPAAGDPRTRMQWKRDDPYFLTWPARVLGVLLALGAGYLWGNAVLKLLEAWIGG